MPERSAARLDGAQLAVLHHRLQGLARKMSNPLLRPGRSGMRSLAKDVSCCIVTSECEVPAAAERLPIHERSGPDLMARWKGFANAG